MAAAETIERRPASAGRRLISTFIARREFGIFLVLVALILYFNARNSAFGSKEKTSEEEGKKEFHKDERRQCIT